MYIDIPALCAWLVGKGELRVPWNLAPGDDPFSPIPLSSESDYENYQWNPPQLVPDMGYDEIASPKPTWAWLVEKWDEMRVEQLQSEINTELNDQATTRIGFVYHEDAQRYPDKEWHVRLSGVDLTRQDAERLRLIGKYQEGKAQCEVATNAEELGALLARVKSESFWA